MGNQADHYVIAEVEGSPDFIRTTLRCEHDSSSPFWSNEHGECLVMQWFDAIQWEAFRWHPSVGRDLLSLPLPITVEPDGDDGWIVRPVEPA